MSGLGRTAFPITIRLYDEHGANRKNTRVLARITPLSGPPYAEVELIATLREWEALYGRLQDLLGGAGDDHWPLEHQGSARRVGTLRFFARPDRVAITVAIDGDVLTVSGPPAGSRSLATLAHNIHFLARPDLFPGSLAAHLHLEPFSSDDTSPYAHGSLPLTITRLWRDKEDEPAGFLPMPAD
jgi:hypothetical protein